MGERQGPRHVSVTADEATRQEERARQRQPEFQLHYRERSRIEHANRLLTMHGGRVSRYWGRTKTALQLLLVGVVDNIEELARVRVLSVSG